MYVCVVYVCLYVCMCMCEERLTLVCLSVSQIVLIKPFREVNGRGALNLANIAKGPSNIHFRANSCKSEYVFVSFVFSISMSYRSHFLSFYV